MKKKYCFIPHSGRLQPGEKVFCVWVGSSDREQVKRMLIDNYAEDVQAFWRVWDEDTDYYLSQVTTCRIKGCERFRFSFERVDVQISDFYKSLINGDISQLRNSSSYLRNSFRLSSLLSPSFFLRNSTISKKSFATSAKRKNLSQRAQSDAINATIGFCLILVLFLLSALLDGVEKTMLLY